MSRPSGPPGRELPLPSLTRSSSGAETSMSPALPTGPFRFAHRFRNPTRPPARSANRFPGPALPLAALWSAALFGLWLPAAAKDKPAEYRVEGFAISRPLTGRAGDPARGECIVRDPDKATCLICHAIPIEGEPDPGNIGPPLHGVASRYTAGELRLRLVDPKRLNPETAMPSYYARGDLHRVAPEYRGRPIYTANDIEDVIAFLLTLTTDRIADPPGKPCGDRSP